MNATSTLRCATLLLAFCSLSGWANPTGGNVVAGSATIAHQGATTTITQGSERAIIHWADFSVGAGEVTRFLQPGAASATLNRITGGNPTEILGRIEATGSVYVLNPNGVMVGRSGVIATGGTFAAATRGFADDRFMAGDTRAYQGSSSGAVTNLGTIDAGGDAILIGRTVRNGGTVRAAGSAVLAAGDEIFLQRQSDDTLRVQFARGTAGAPAGEGVGQSGTIDAVQAELAAAGGLYALAINAGGNINATGVAERGGRIYLTAAGGEIAANGTLRAARENLGGEIYLGGGVQGKDPAIANAARVSVGESARLDAGGDGQEGGKVVAWADDHTRFAGTADTGAVGFVEVSGKQTLDFTGMVNTRGGTLLLDPTDLVIDDARLATIRAQLLNGSVIVSATGDLTYSANGNVTVGSNPSTGRGYGLSLSADQNLRFAAGSMLGLSGPLPSLDLYANGGDIVLGDGAVIAVGASGVVSLAATRHLTFGASSSLTVASGGSIHGRADATAFINLPEGGFFTVSPDRIGGLNFGSAATVDAAQVQFFAPRATDYVNTSFYTPPQITYNTAPSYTLPGSGIWFLSDQNGNFGGGPPTATLTITANDASRRYGQANPTFTASYAGFINGDTPSVVTGLQFSTTATLGSNVGTYSITPFGASAPATYTSIQYVPGTLTINPAPLSIIADNFTRRTGAANPTFTARYSGFVNGDTSAVVSGLQFATPADANSPAGSYTITPFGATAANYSISYGPGTLSVIDTLVGFITLQPQDATRAYGAPNPTFALRPITGDLQTGDSVASVNYVTTATLGSNVGTYQLHAADAVMNAPSGYFYNISYLPATFTITPAALTLRVNDAARATGQANPGFTADLLGLAPFDRAADVIRYSLATSAGADSPRGLYAINAAADLLSSNYALTVQPGTLRVNQTLTLQPADVARLYGAENPAFALRPVTGLLPGDSIAGVDFTTTATVGSNVGTYSILASNARLNRSTDEAYAFNYLPGTLTITPAPLTLLVDSKFHTTAHQRPPLTATLTGLRNGDVESAVLRYDLFAAQPASQPTGRFPIEADTTLLSPNYTVAVEPGTLTVHPATGVVEDLTKREFVVTEDLGNGIVQGYMINRPPSFFGVPAQFSEQIYQIVRAYGAANGWGDLTNNAITTYLDTFGWNADFQGAMLPFTLQLAKSIRRAVDAKAEVSASDRAFLDWLEGSIRAERIAAAEKGLADYRAWKADNEARKNAQTNPNLLTVLNYGWDEVPPSSFLATAQSGLLVNPNELGLWASLLRETPQRDVVKKVIDNAWQAGFSERQAAWAQQTGNNPLNYVDPPVDYEAAAERLGIRAGSVGSAFVPGQLNLSGLHQTLGSSLVAGTAAGIGTAATIGSIMPFAGTVTTTATVSTVTTTTIGSWVPGIAGGVGSVSTVVPATVTTGATTTVTSTTVGAISTATIAATTAAVSAITVVASIIFNKALNDVIQIQTTEPALFQAIEDAKAPVNLNQLSDSYLLFALASISTKQLQAGSTLR
jgi:filamentous hemagglutinin family protein